MLKAQVAEQLQRIVTKRGCDIGSNPRLLRALLSDYCPADRLESNLLIQAAQAQVPADMLLFASVPWNLLQVRMVSRLVDELGIARENAEWAVEAWGMALGCTETTLHASETTAATTPDPALSAESETHTQNGAQMVSLVQHVKTDSPPAPAVAVGTPSKGVLPRPLCVFKPGKDRINGLLFTPDGQSLLTRTSDENVQLFHVVTGIPGRIYIQREAFHSVSSDGKVLALVSQGNVILIDALSGKRLREWRAHKSSIHCLQFSHDNVLLATGSDDGTAKIWETENGRLVYKLGSLLKKHKAGVQRVAFSPDGRTLATHAEDETWFWEVGTGQSLKTRQTGLIRALFYLPDGTLVTLGYGLWVQRGEKRTEWKGKYSYHSTVLSPNAQLVAEYEETFNYKLNKNTSTAPVILWDVASKSELMSIEGYTAGISYAKFSPDSTRLALGMEDGTVHVWQVR